MKRLAVLALWASSAAAADLCTRLDYAEMEAMGRTALLAERCEYHRAMLEATRAAGSMYGLSKAEGCANELTRMDRVLAKKYSLKATGDDLIVSVNALCRKAPAK